MVNVAGSNPIEREKLKISQIKRNIDRWEGKKFRTDFTKWVQGTRSEDY